MTSFYLNDLLQGPTPKYSRVGVMASTHEFEGTEFIPQHGYEMLAHHIADSPKMLISPPLLFFPLPSLPPLPSDEYYIPDPVLGWGKSGK